MISSARSNDSIHPQANGIRRRLEALLEKPWNHLCCDCSEEDPKWATIIVALPGAPPLVDAIGAFCCFDCSRAHRSLGTNTDLSVYQGEWNERYLRALELGGSQLLNKVFGDLQFSGDLYESQQLGIGGDDFRARKKFMQDKYKHRKFYDPEKFDDILSLNPSVHADDKEKLQPMQDNSGLEVEPADGGITTYRSNLSNDIPNRTSIQDESSSRHSIHRSSTTSQRRSSSGNVRRRRISNTKPGRSSTPPSLRLSPTNNCSSTTVASTMKPIVTDKKHHMKPNHHRERAEAHSCVTHELRRIKSCTAFNEPSTVSHVEPSTATERRKSHHRCYRRKRSPSQGRHSKSTVRKFTTIQDMLQKSPGAAEKASTKPLNDDENVSNNYDSDQESSTALQASVQLLRNSSLDGISSNPEKSSDIHAQGASRVSWHLGQDYSEIVKTITDECLESEKRLDIPQQRAERRYVPTLRRSGTYLPSLEKSMSSSLLLSNSTRRREVGTLRRSFESLRQNYAQKSTGNNRHPSQGIPNETFSFGMSTNDHSCPSRKSFPQIHGSKVNREQKSTGNNRHPSQGIPNETFSFGTSTSDHSRPPSKSFPQIHGSKLNRDIPLQATPEKMLTLEAVLEDLIAKREERGLGMSGVSSYLSDSEDKCMDKKKKRLGLFRSPSAGDLVASNDGEKFRIPDVGRISFTSFGKITSKLIKDPLRASINSFVGRMDVEDDLTMTHHSLPASFLLKRPSSGKESLLQCAEQALEKDTTHSAVPVYSSTHDVSIPLPGPELTSPRLSVDEKKNVKIETKFTGSTPRQSYRRRIEQDLLEDSLRKPCRKRLDGPIGGDKLPELLVEAEEDEGQDDSVSRHRRRRRSRRSRRSIESDGSTRRRESHGEKRLNSFDTNTLEKICWTSGMELRS